ncbi:MAG: radical SAM protein [Sulfurimonadaceae bacterium]|nr:radical SAM protein [Sulfurimonadaceae bacterium]
MYLEKMHNILSTNAIGLAKYSLKNIFGPINSRRFGTSLGIDLSAYTKVCNFDCLYCELIHAAPTTKQLHSSSVDEIIDELKTQLNQNIDIITITANGEPTLYPYLNELIDELNKIKNKTQTLILTNSSTLNDSKIFNALLKLDQVKFSLDAISPDIFKKIDRPAKGIDIEDIIKNIIAFSEVFKGKIFIEILFVKGVNDKADELKKLNSVLLKIKNISRVDIGTIDRPPAYSVKPLSHKELYELSLAFDKTLPIYIASRKTGQKAELFYSDEEILNTLNKRPLSLEDIEILFDKSTRDRFEQLLKEGKITTKKVGELEFFTT